MRARRRRWLTGLVAAMGTVAVGCAASARVDLSAADALVAAADQMDVVVKEYHEDVGRFDDTRESEVVTAFVDRVQRDPADEKAIANHVTAFKAALKKIRDDRETERTRRDAAGQNVRVVREVARGLRRLAIESLSLDDEVRRYLTSWLEIRGAAGAASSVQEGEHE